MDVNELCKQLQRLQLVTPWQLDECRMQLGKGEFTNERILDWLCGRGWLTSYQVGHLKKGETSSLLLNQYKVLYRVSAGSFARVYRAVDVRNGEQVALKVLRQRWSMDGQAVAQFRKEAELGKTLQHPNIVPIFEVGRSGDQYYFSMEFVEGGNLRELLNIRKKLTPADATKCVLEMAEGLQYALSKGFMHRDLKLTNVLMSTSGVCKLVDFGLAGGSVLAAQKAGADEHTQRALDYAVLEDGTGAQRDDPRSDLFFLGAIYYELISGVAPLSRTRDRNERGQFSRYENITPLREVEPTLPRSITAIVDRLMQLSPGLRYQSASDLIRDLKVVDPDTRDASTIVSTPQTRIARTADVPTTTVMFLENRPRQQDMLRDYFSKHRFRVLVLSDVSRCLQRLKSNPPDGVVVMAEGIGDDSMAAFQEIQALRSEMPVARLLVISDKHSDWKEHIDKTSNSRVLQQPVTLRDLRKTLTTILNDNAADTGSGEHRIARK
jgi:serine/threonine protein kinase